jgi:hypothetical protein
MNYIKTIINYCSKKANNLPIYKMCAIYLIILYTFIKQFTIFKQKHALGFVFTILLSIIGFTEIKAQSVGDYRSRQSGPWQAASTWEMFDGVAWQIATAQPNAPNNLTIQLGDSVFIQPNSTVTLFNDITVQGILNVQGRLNCMRQFIWGMGKFMVSSQTGFLGIGDSLGISQNFNYGNIRTLNRSFSSLSNYVYQGLNKQFTGDGLPSVIRSLTIDNLQPFSDTSGVVITKHIAITDTLYFVNGKVIALDSSRLITMRPLAGVKGFSSERFVNGPIRISWEHSTSTRKFVPIGKDTMYRPLDITYNHNNSNLNVYQYELINHAPHYTTIANSANYNHISNKRYWQCFRTTGSSTINNSSLGFSWGPSDHIVQYLDLDVGRSNNSRTQWERIQGNPSHQGNNSFGFVFVSDNNPSTAFDYILVSKSTFNLLPVSLQKFAIDCFEDNQYKVTWITTEEQHIKNYNLRLYNIEGEEIYVQNVSPKGGMFQTAFYSIPISLNMQIGKGGLWEETIDGMQNLLTEQILAPCKEHFSLYINQNPSPIGSVLTIKSKGTPTSQTFSALIIDTKGKHIHNQTIRIQEEQTWQLAMPNDELAGVYFVKFIIGNEVESHKIIRY